jgi:hypothetical protein
MTKRVLAFTFIFAFLPFAGNAASKNSANVVIDENVTVGTTELPKGTYKVVWTGTDTNAQVTFTSGNWTKTVPARVDRRQRQQDVLNRNCAPQRHAAIWRGYAHRRVRTIHTEAQHKLVVHGVPTTVRGRVERPHKHL